MTALPLEPHTEAEEATLKRIEGAEPAEESAVEKVARAIYGEGAWCGVCGYDGWDHCSECRRTVREYAAAAIEAMKGPSPAEEAPRPGPAIIALAWHDVVCPESWECRDRPLHAAAQTIANTGHLAAFLDRLAAIAAPVAQAGEER